MPRRETLPDRVARLVDRYGSDGKLAKAIGTTHQVVIGWRHGDHEPRYDSRVKLAKAEGSDPAEWHALAKRRGGRQTLANLSARLDRQAQALQETTRKVGDLIRRLEESGLLPPERASRRAQQEHDVQTD